MREEAPLVCCQDFELWHKRCDGQVETLMQVLISELAVVLVLHCENADSQL